MTSEPNGRYLRHFTPQKSTATATATEPLANSLFGWMGDHGVDETLLVIGAGSTDMNTGWRGNTIHHLEEKVGTQMSSLTSILSLDWSQYGV